MAVMENPTAFDLVKRRDRVEALATGRVRIRRACPSCNSTNLYDEDRQWWCMTCGRATTDHEITRLRSARVRRFLRTGEM